MAAINWLLHIRAVPGMPIVCATCCSSGSSNAERPVPCRRRALGGAAAAPPAPAGPPTDALDPALEPSGPSSAEDAGRPRGVSPGAADAPLRNSVVSLTNGPSVTILGRHSGRSAGHRDPAVPRRRFRVSLICVTALALGCS